MQTTTKTARPSSHGQRTALGHMMVNFRRSWSANGTRRLPRPLQDIDSWSDQAEVAFYEDARLSRLA